MHDQTATLGDLSRIIMSFEMRDQRIQQAEAELRKLNEEYRKLRDELLPVFRMAKDQSQPLPYHPTGSSPSLHNNHDDIISPGEKTGNIARKFSTKRFLLGSTPKNNSPTHMPQSLPEGKAMADASNLDPSAAAVAASTHLTASISGSNPATSPNQPNIPSPTSPNNYPKSQLPPHTYGTRSVQPYANDSTLYPASTSTLDRDRDRGIPTPTPTVGSRPHKTSRDQLEEPPSSGNREPSVEIFKSFRVSMEDPCHKVLPAALKKYNINADWRQYALYIVYGDQERCLGLEEKPLILFKQLDREGRKPMFMLRRHAAPIEGHSGPSATGSGGMQASGFESQMGLGRGHSSSIQLPGGVL